MIRTKKGAFLPLRRMAPVTEWPMEATDNGVRGYKIDNIEVFCANNGDYYVKDYQEGGEVCLSPREVPQLIKLLYAIILPKDGEWVEAEPMEDS